MDQLERISVFQLCSGLFYFNALPELVNEIQNHFHYFHKNEEWAKEHNKCFLVKLLVLAALHKEILQIYVLGHKK